MRFARRLRKSECNVSDSVPTLTVGSKGFLHWGELRLLIRYEDGLLFFPVKHPGDRARLQCKQVGIPLDEFAKLESAPAPALRRLAGRMPRERGRKIVTRRNNQVDKSG